MRFPINEYPDDRRIVNYRSYEDEEDVIVMEPPNAPARIYRLGDDGAILGMVLIYHDF